ncbi:MAG: efflux RND transporter periplasmic adaptor subunit [Thermodesulfobacteriota bacterium]
MKKGRLIFALAAGIAIVLAAVILYSNNKEDGNFIKLSGNIEATEVAISFKIPGRLVERRFDEGQWVEKGAVVACLDDTDLKHQVAVARANLAAMQARLKELLAGSRTQEIKQAEAALKQAEAEMQNKERDLNRLLPLYEAGIASKKARDDAATAYKISQEAYQKARENYALVKEGPRKEDIEAARAQVALAEASLKLAETNLSYATVYAPIPGVVLSKAAEPGEVLSPGRPVLTLGDIGYVWLRAYIDEKDLGKVKWGQEALVTTDSYPGKVYKGRVSFISSQAEFTPKTVQTEKERVTLVYRVKVDLDNQDRELKPGMIADCRIRIGP